MIGWHTATHKNERKEVIHLTTGTNNPVTWGKFLDYSRDAAQTSPSMRMVRPLATNPTSGKGPLGKMNHLVTKYVSHILFAYLVDIMLTLLGYQRIMVKMTQKMHRAFTVLEHFTTKEWCFHNDNYFLIYDNLPEEEKKTYFSDVRQIDWRKYAENVYLGTRRYLLKEDDSTVEKAKQRLNFICLIYKLFQIVLVVIAMYFIFYKFFS